MADLTYIPEVALQADEAQTVPRPPLLVRFTQWTFRLGPLASLPVRLARSIVGPALHRVGSVVEAFPQGVTACCGRPFMEFDPQLRARPSALQAYRAGCRRALQRSATPVLSRRRLRGVSLHD